MTELRQIPNVGKRTEQELLAMGYTSIESLRGKSGEELYVEECRLRGCTIDRCQLYLYRAVSYFVNTEHPDRSKCNGGCGKMRWPTLRPVVRYVPSVAIIRYRAGDAGPSRGRSFGCRIPATTSAPSIAVAGSRGGQIAGVVPNCLADVSPKTPRLVTKRTKPT